MHASGGAPAKKHNQKEAMSRRPETITSRRRTSELIEINGLSPHKRIDIERPGYFCVFNYQARLLENYLVFALFPLQLFQQS